MRFLFLFFIFTLNCFVLNAQRDTVIQRQSKTKLNNAAQRWARPYYVPLVYYSKGRTDSLKQPDGTWCSYYAPYKEGEETQMFDSGYYEHGRKKGLWIIWNQHGKVSARLWYNTNDTIPVHILTYFPNGFKRHEAERIKEQHGEKRIVKIYSGNDKLMETQVIYEHPREQLKGIIYTQLDCDDYLSDYVYYYPVDKRRYFSANGQHTDSCFNSNGFLTEVEKANRITKYFINGKPSAYFSHDTILTWYDNGQLASQSVNLRNTHILSPMSDAVLNPYGVSRYWLPDGQLLHEVYDYPTNLPAFSTVRLGDEKNQIRGEGKTDERGYKHGQWLFFQQDENGSRWVSEKGSFEHGIKTGVWTGLYPDGKKKYETDFKPYKAKLYPRAMYSKTAPRGEGDQLIIKKNRRDLIIVRASEMQDRYVSYYPNGKVQYDIRLGKEAEYNGTWQFFDTTGKLLAYRNYNGGKPADSAYWCYPDGHFVEKTWYDSAGQFIRSKKFSPPLPAFEFATPKALNDYSFTTNYAPDPFELLYHHCDGFERLYTAPGNLRQHRVYAKQQEKKKRKSRRMNQRYIKKAMREKK